VYAVFASLWILLSDNAVAWLFSDPNTMTQVSMGKGWLFVAVTALLLYGLIHRMTLGLQEALQKASLHEQQLQDSEALLLDAHRIAGLGNYSLDIEKGLWTSSSICDQVFGIDASYPRSVRGWADLVHPDERADLEDYFASIVLGQGQSFDREYRIVRPCDGAERWVHGLGQLELNALGRLKTMQGTIQDITERKLAQIAIEAARNQLQATLDALPDLLFEVDREGRIRNYHSHRDDLLAAPPEAFMGKRFAELLPMDATQACQSAIDEAAQVGFSTGVTYRLALPHGEHWFELSVSQLHTDARLEQRFIMIARDITERKRAEKELQLAAGVFSHSQEGITITDVQGTIINVNAAFSRITGYSREEAIGQNPRMLRSGRQDAAFYADMWNALLIQGHWSGEIWNRRKDGEVYAEMLTITAVRDSKGKTTQYIALFSDITALKSHQSELDRIAHFDALTGLPNRLLLADRLYQAMNQVTRRGLTLAVAYLDLDFFKGINDQHGHAVGDELLVAIAHRLKQTLREADTLARMGGDEFVAVLIDLESAEASQPMLERMVRAAAEPVAVGDLWLQVSASLGVTFYPQGPEMDADQLLRQADQAMYQAKLSGKNRFHLFDAEQDSNIRGHHESLENIRLGLERNEFVLHYQPKVNMRSGCVVGAEALIRWQHPQRGLLAPAAFLPATEDDPIAVAIGEWAIDTALRQIEQWRESGLDLPVSVNIGARQLQQADFVERLQAILTRHPQVASNLLELEILETSALKDIAQVSQVIEACAQIGVMFALDDFGTGYSSLTYLKRLRVSLLKIDQSFVRDMLDDPDDLAILEGVIGLASAFKRDVIAEGVETVAHGTRLLQLGCDLGQGYGIARPMPGAAMPAWATAWRPAPEWLKQK
jgi:diguanylate cyclase (GGDEF)-like protein/PAS domain S-box-containing protein